MTPCYEPFKNLLIVLENAFEVIVKDKNNISSEKPQKTPKNGGKNTFFFKLLPTCPQGSLGGVFNRPVEWSFEFSARAKPKSQATPPTRPVTLRCERPLCPGAE